MRYLTVYFGSVVRFDNIRTQSNYPALLFVLNGIVSIGVTDICKSRYRYLPDRTTGRDIAEIDLRSPDNYFFMLRNGEQQQVTRGNKT